ncbi:hypothetical protein A2841_00190 [Candidatus Kaiserbacteria bacterium RIFCSPHIGHO2_01_FULL_48_10]|uniref:NADH-quinone oxidoreductase subunit J n=1 Tax=Candidatus Kaiserbacteria bacterium RIFCSPHIGHO2_01_FULL_48_10 TaxID=1798476 RepID=A0A1F6C5Q3_9BACT|nr:MAG: hypothetical protein A2841_00190 [Candidatus Kaiserbacteria bacterium RIFCSPHIGHO2_01_FULL_48_10]
MEVILFWVTSVIAIGSVLWMLWARRIVDSVLALTTFFVAIAILFGMLGAQFLAIGQILIFVGGIVVLMLLAIGAAGFEEVRKKYQIRAGYAMVTGGFLFFLVMPFLTMTLLPAADAHDVKKVAEIFFNQYGILVVLAGLIIFTSLVSAIYFLKKDE